MLIVDAAFNYTRKTKTNKAGSKETSIQTQTLIHSGKFTVQNTFN